MATLTVTIPAGNETGAILRKLADNINQIAANVPDKVAGGASTTLVFDNGPATGFVSVQLTGGPYTSSAVIA